MKFFRERLSYANVMATAALFIALGGGAYAHGLAKNSVKSKHIVNGQVKTPDLANAAVKPSKLAPGAVRTPNIGDGAVSETKLAPGLRTRINQLEGKVAAQQNRISNLETLLDGVSRQTVEGYDTLRFSEMNVQVVNGTGTTSGTPNGLGNLLVGYSSQRPGPAATRTGSHYLVVGDQHQWTSYGGILAGEHNTASGDRASVFSGFSNRASGYGASVSGGSGNIASGSQASVSGGFSNTASGGWSSILGGASRTVTGTDACHPTC